jgi:hypothetical protein
LALSRTGLASCVFFYCFQEETDDNFSNHICGTWLLPLHESWFEDDGESWVGWVASTIKPPTQILLTHCFSCFALKNGKQQCFCDQNQLVQISPYCTPTAHTSFRPSSI